MLSKMIQLQSLCDGLEVGAEQKSGLEWTHPSQDGRSVKVQVLTHFERTHFWFWIFDVHGKTGKCWHCEFVRLS